MNSLPINPEALSAALSISSSKQMAWNEDQIFLLLQSVQIHGGHLNRSTEVWIKTQDHFFLQPLLLSEIVHYKKGKQDKCKKKFDLYFAAANKTMNEGNKSAFYSICWQ